MPETECELFFVIMIAACISLQFVGWGNLLLSMQPRAGMELMTLAWAVSFFIGQFTRHPALGMAKMNCGMERHWPGVL